jgi:plasmid stabilization system protein ParE
VDRIQDEMCSRKAPFIRSPDARDDIDDISLFTRQQWGGDQRRTYKQRLGEVFDTLLLNPRWAASHSVLLRRQEGQNPPRNPSKSRS